MSTRKINDWHAAGLIDADLRGRLIAYEEENARPLALWAVFGIGALTIGLGLISVVAANWEDIPGQIRLAIHLLLIVAGLAAVLLRERELVQASPWAVEALVFILAMLGLTFFGHLGQVYQTTSPLWQPIAVWVLLFGPLILVFGRSWLTAALLFGFFTYGCWDFALRDVFFGSGGDFKWAEYVVATSLPALFIPFSAWMRGRSDRVSFWVRLEQVGLSYAVAGASLVCAIASIDEFDGDEIGLNVHFTRLCIAAFAAALVLVVRPTVSGRMTAAILGGTGVAMLFAFGVSGSEVMAGIVFMALWSGIAWAALYAGWRGVFQAAVGVIALRLIVLSFELASDLLLSGFGLILSGIMILGIAWVAVRVSREFAPPTDPAIGPAIDAQPDAGPDSGEHAA